MATELARPEKPDEPRWNPATRVLFRFACVYLILVLLPFPFDRVPSIGGVIGGVYGEGWNQAVAWLSRRLLGLQLTVFTNGSGDTTYNYLLVLVHASLAVLATVLWTALDGSRPNYSRVHAWLRTYLRFALAAILFSYGAAKVFKSQFPDPPASRLLEPLGEMSPMGLLWSFMGASEAYTVFGGLAETIPAILLLFGRTTLLGALAAACTLTNVVMLNFCYDVPVKIYSLHLLAISLFLIAPDATRLLDFFVRNRTVAPRPGPAYGASSRMLTALTVAGMAGMALYAILTFTAARPSRESSAHGQTQAPLHGLWTVDEFGTDGVNLMAAKDDVRWRHMTLPFPGALTIHLMNGKVRWYDVYVDEKRHLLFLTNRGDGSHDSLSYAEDQEGLTLTGTLSGHMIRARLRRTALSDFPLRSRGFHWINEYPFNR